MLAQEYGVTKFASELIAYSAAPTTTLLESAVIPDSENDVSSFSPPLFRRVYEY